MSETTETGDLTSLSWLHNLNIMDNLSVTTAPPTPPASPLPGPAAAVAAAAAATAAAATAAPTPVESSKVCGKESKNGSRRSIVKEEEKEIDYKLVGDAKPPYSYASLICMAMKAIKHKMTLSAIYKWIRENFLYYKNADPSWQVRLLINLVVVYCMYGHTIDSAILFLLTEMANFIGLFGRILYWRALQPQ